MYNPNVNCFNVPDRIRVNAEAGCLSKESSQGDSPFNQPLIRIPARNSALADWHVTFRSTAWSQGRAISGWNPYELLEPYSNIAL